MGLSGALWTVVFAGSAAYLARKDLAKVFRVLKKPTENFLKDVKAEMEAGKPGQLPGTAPPPAAPGPAPVHPPSDATVPPAPKKPE